jgi:hypothetical protein
VKPRPRIAVWRWALWWFLLVLADVVFYVLLTPIWLGIRLAGWLADRRARTVDRLNNAS